MGKSLKLKKRAYSSQNKSTVSRLKVCFNAVWEFLKFLMYYSYRLQYWNPFYIIREKQRKLYFFNNNGVAAVQPKWKERIINLLLSDKKRREKILDWVNRKIPQRQVQDFSESWNDGIALCALLDALRPGVCPGYKHFKHHNRVNNCRVGIKLARQCFELPREIIQPEEMAIADKNTEPKILKYISMIKWASETAPSEISVPTEMLTETQIPACVVKGAGVDSGIIGRKARFTLSTPNVRGMFQINIDIKNPKNEVYSETIISLDHSSKFLRGIQMKNLLLGNESTNVDNSIMEYLDDGFGNTYIRWKNLKQLGSVVSHDTLSFDFRCYGEEVFLITYLPVLAGIHTISIRWGNVHIEGSPFKVKIYQPRDLTRRTIKDAKDKRVMFQSMSLSSIDEKSHGASLAERSDQRKAGRSNETRKKLKSDRLSTSKIRKQYTVTKRRIIRKVINRNGEEIIIHESPSPSLSRQSSFTDTSTEDEAVRRNSSFSAQKNGGLSTSPALSFEKPSENAIASFSNNGQVTSSSLSVDLKSPGSLVSESPHTFARDSETWHTENREQRNLNTPMSETLTSGPENDRQEAPKSLSVEIEEQEVSEGRSVKNDRIHRRSYSDSLLQSKKLYDSFDDALRALQQREDDDILSSSTIGNFGDSKLFALKLLKSNSTRKSCCYISGQIGAAYGVCSGDSSSNSSTVNQSCSACDLYSVQCPKGLQNDQLDCDSVFCGRDKVASSAVGSTSKTVSTKQNVTREDEGVKMFHRSPKSSIASYTESDDSSLFSTDVRIHHCYHKENATKEFTSSQPGDNITNFGGASILQNTDENPPSFTMLETADANNLKGLEYQEVADDRASRHQRSTKYWLENQTTDQFSFDLADDLPAQHSTSSKTGQESLDFESMYSISNSMAMVKSDLLNKTTEVLGMDLNSTNLKSTDTNLSERELTDGTNCSSDKMNINLDQNFKGKSREQSTDDKLLDKTVSFCNLQDGAPELISTAHIPKKSQKNGTTNAGSDPSFWTAKSYQTQQDGESNTHTRAQDEKSLTNDRKWGFHRQTSLRNSFQNKCIELQQESKLKYNKGGKENRQRGFQSICPENTGSMHPTKRKNSAKVDILVPKFKANKSTQVHANEILQETQFLLPLLNLKIVKRKRYVKRSLRDLETSSDPDNIMASGVTKHTFCEYTIPTRHPLANVSSSSNACRTEASINRWFDLNDRVVARPIRQSTADTIDSGISEENINNKLQFTKFYNLRHIGHGLAKGHRKYIRRAYRGRIDLGRKGVVSGSNSDSRSLESDVSKRCASTGKPRRRDKTALSVRKKSGARKQLRHRKNEDESLSLSTGKSEYLRKLSVLRKNRKISRRRSYKNSDSDNADDRISPSDSSKHGMYVRTAHSDKDRKQKSTDLSSVENDYSFMMFSTLSQNGSSSFQEEMNDGFGVSLFERDHLLKCIQDFQNINGFGDGKGVQPNGDDDSVPTLNAKDEREAFGEIHEWQEKSNIPMKFISSLSMEIKPGRFISSIEKDMMPIYETLVNTEAIQEVENFDGKSRDELDSSLYCFDAMENMSDESSYDVKSPYCQDSSCNDNGDDDVSISDSSISFSDSDPMKLSPFDYSQNLELTQSDSVYCRAEGVGLSEGQVGIHNNFQIWTNHHGNGSVSVTIHGPKAHSVIETNVVYTGDNLYEVMYEVKHPGYYIISIKWGDECVPGSPFLSRISY